MGWKRCCLSSSVLFLRQERLEGKVSGTEVQEIFQPYRPLSSVNKSFQDEVKGRVRRPPILTDRQE